MTFFDFLIIIGALGFFIYGMKVMSDGIQKVAGSKMRNILSSMTSNRFLGITTGFLITALLQSSSATTVMTVSFVNAGLLSLVESIGVIMGANIGTTITAWLISILGFKIKISTIALPIIAVGFPLMFSKKSNIKAWAEVLIGFALLFMGLDELKHAVPDLKQNPGFLSFLADYADKGYFSTIIFIGVGTILTLVVQSSSAAMALTLVMCFEGYIPFELAAAMVLGENIGTTITANLAALVANVHAKRAARAHFIFNVFGVIWMIIAFPFVIELIDQYMTIYMGMSPLNPEDKSATVPLGLSIFHTTFNIFNVLLLVGFVPFMAKNDYGRIVNIASIAGKEGNPNASAYSTSKAGVIGLTKSLGKELALKNIAVNCVTPAAAKTRIFDQMTEEHINYMLSKIPRNKFAKVEELASLVTWLSSEENSFSTAAVFDLSGGRATY